MERTSFLPARRKETRHLRLFSRFCHQRPRWAPQRRGPQSAPHQAFGRRSNARSQSKESAPAGESAQRQDTRFRLTASKRPAAQKTKDKGFTSAATRVGKSRIDLRKRKLVMGARCTFAALPPHSSQLPQSLA